jgi:D-methionine transport system permease protein
MLHDLLNASEETLFMVFTAGMLTATFGLPLGLYLALSKRKIPLNNKLLRKALQLTLSTPYLVFVITLIPFARFISGTPAGTFAAILPLTFATLPNFAKLTETAITKLPRDLIALGESMGARPVQILYKILLPEAMPKLIEGFTTTLIHLVGFSIIAGLLGAGGLGSFLLQHGYQAFNPSLLLLAILILFLLTQTIHLSGQFIMYGSLKK